MPNIFSHKEYHFNRSDYTDLENDTEFTTAPWTLSFDVIDGDKLNIRMSKASLRRMGLDIVAITEELVEPEE